MNSEEIVKNVIIIFQRDVNLNEWMNQSYLGSSLTRKRKNEIENDAIDQSNIGAPKFQICLITANKE